MVQQKLHIALGKAREEDKAMEIKITESIHYVGVDDKTIDLFESQYLVPEGVSYNSYVILDDQIAVMDTVDGRLTKEAGRQCKNVFHDGTVF